jgi:hypothetical protein
MVEINVIF